MEVILSSELEKLVSEKLRSGRYPTAEAVVAEALHLLNERDQAETRLEAALEEAEVDAGSTEMTDEEWARIEHEGLGRLRASKPE
jgi:antitoxin ParD1/3/4